MKSKTHFPSSRAVTRFLISRVFVLLGIITWITTIPMVATLETQTILWPLPTENHINFSKMGKWLQTYRKEVRKEREKKFSLTKKKKKKYWIHWSNPHTEFMMPTTTWLDTGNLYFVFRSLHSKKNQSHTTKVWNRNFSILHSLFDHWMAHYTQILPEVTNQSWEVLFAFLPLGQLKCKFSIKYLKTSLQNLCFNYFADFRQKILRSPSFRAQS